ncbi:MAG: hypothetical protein WC700_10160 [Gemmatimonadaceae bacterium]|jgi:hypothetical protein
MDCAAQRKLLIAILIVLVIAVAGYAWYHQAWMKKNCTCQSKSNFTSDLDGWPGAGTFGNLADTNPYANYAGGVDMYWPTYSEGAYQDLLWTKT